MSKESQKGTFLGAISPWNVSRSTTPQPASGSNDRPDFLQRSQGQDHTVTHRHRLSSHRYPKDCPLLRVRWFYAVDSPKWKPELLQQKRDASKAFPPPKKFIPFSPKDSLAIETAFQHISDVEDGKGGNQPNETIGDTPEVTKIPVNEDYLFDVDVESRELSPAYWIGPVYEVRRGTWFVQDGSAIKPCEENLATQLEEGYLKVRPWRFEEVQEPSTSRSRPENSGQMAYVPANGAHSYRLFGAYMNSLVTYQDSSTALLVNDDFMSRVSTTVYQKLGGVPGTRLVRGFAEINRQREASDVKNPNRKSTQGPVSTLETHPPGSQSHRASENMEHRVTHSQDSQSKSTSGVDQRSTFERQMSSLTGEPRNAAEIEEQARRQEEKEMEDSRQTDDDNREREIDHLVLVTHGIGQRLGLRLESINFIHDVNVLRKTMKNVYKASPDLQALNSAFTDKHDNCRVQVLPVCWRHLLDFPYRGMRHNRKELDIADADNFEDDLYPGLADITLDSVPAVRNLISDLAMDVLLYQSAYCERISTIVKQECNRILKTFKKRNPSFKGSVSLCGHSLGSAILFDILCRESSTTDLQRPSDSMGQREMPPTSLQDEQLEFECKELFCLGSPIALFQMLKGKTIAGRSVSESKAPRTMDGKETLETPPTVSSSNAPHINAGFIFNDDRSHVSSPKCEQLYNIFHPSDPVSYRIEPLISPAMSSLRPQSLPSVKRSLWAASGQSLSIIGSRVGQSVGSLWSNFTSGVASSLLNRSLGLNSEDIPLQSSSNSATQPQPSLTTDVESMHILDNRHPTLIDSDLETLYEGFPKAKDGRTKDVSVTASDDTAEYQENEARMKRLRIEDAKVRCLNSNGRVDYSIQEGAFDISLIASIASHLTYWADEDVNHFMLSQMLSRRTPS
ncbi:DDHD domain-containing protein [Aspergillus alliaceus]|uniref:DDHD domain-containing protein n=1 Tax=Petromyces alliaceus TaxID=209559 RepID=UPI0012A4E995|nr:DDHD domain-containing protein [Aspergillus alliaceus]KAB8232358.1 DDHD domain-containing protein [Aspergillus alliaceus]